MDKTYALIGPDNKAKNFILCDGTSPYAVNGHYLVEIVEGMRYGYEWEWNGTSFTPPQDPVAVIPEAITPRQARLLLLQQNLLASVESLISQQDEATKIAWEYASEFRRTDPLLTSLAQQLGLTSQQLDDFFIAASVL